MSTAVLTKFILHRFLSFRHVELNFQKTTIINGIKQPAEVLVDFLNAFKLMLNNSSDETVEDMRMIDFADSSVNDPTYLEAHFFTSEGFNFIFRKTLLDGTEIIYTLNDNPTSQDDFKNQLAKFGFDLSSLIIDAQTVERIALMREEARGAFIEKFCSTPEFVFTYQQFKSKIDNMQAEMKSLLDLKKELKAEKEIEKTKVDSLKKFGDTMIDFNKFNEEFHLFELYHNNRAIENGPRKIEDLQEELNSFKVQHLESLKAQNSHIDDFLGLEGFSMESNSKLRVKLKEKLKAQRSLENVRQEIEFLELQSGSEGFDVDNFNGEIDRHKKSLEELDSLKVRLEPIHAEYLNLQREFIKDNLKLLTPYNTMKKLIFDKINNIIESVKLFESQITEIVADRSSYGEKIKAITNHHEAVHKEIQTLLDKKNELTLKSHSKAQAISKLESITNLKNKIKCNQQEIVDKLRKKFSYSIVGRLCDLFDVVAVNGIDVKHQHILERLGKYAEAIVVDSQEVADKCVEFLKLQLHQEINTLIIPLSNCNEVSTAEAMKKFKLPGNIKGEPIEKFIQAKHPEIQKLLMNILKPTIVTDNAPNLEIIFEAVEKKLRVTSFESFITLNPNRSIQTHARLLLDTEFPNETLLMMKGNLQKFRVEMIEMNADLDFVNLKLSGFEHKREYYERHLKMLNSLLYLNGEAIQMAMRKLDQAKETLRKLENIKGLNEMKRKYRELKGAIQPLEVKHYQNFLKKHGYKSVEEYDAEYSQVFPENNYNNRRAFFVSRMTMNEKIKAKYAAFNNCVNSQHVESANERLNTLQESFKTIDKDLTEIREQNTKINEQLEESYKKTLEKRTEFNELEKKVESLQLSICDEMINIQIALTENYQLLYLALINCVHIPLKDGSFMKLLEVPDVNEIDDNFNLISNNLKGLEINYDGLDAELKLASDVPKKKNDMIKKLRQLNQFLDEFALDVTGDEQHLSSIAKKLNLVVAETRKLTKNFQNVTEEFRNICNERENRFNECLKVINDEIEKVCAVGLQGKVKGLLEVADKKEPCLHGVYYKWWNEDKIEELVTDLNRNYEAAFAFLMGLIKYKKQKFVIFNNSAKIMLNDIDLKSLIEYLKSDESLQVIALLASQVNSVEENCDYTIMKRDEKFIFLPKM